MASSSAREAGEPGALNVLLVSHCDFDGNSAYHVLAIARELHRRGSSPVICLPWDRETVDLVGVPPFPVLTYSEAQAGALLFPDGNGPDLIHAFTPREHVRLVTESLSSRYSCPYVVHLEDNEEVILDDDLAAGSAGGAAPPPLAVLDALAATTHRSHPVRAARFVDRAAGLTAVIEPLLERKPEHVPGVVFWPGFELELLEPRPRDLLREQLGLAPEDVVLVYTGNIHNSNVGEVRSLYIAVGLLRRAGHPVRLVQAGSNHVDMSWVAECVADGDVIALGFVDRKRVGELLAVADVLVQPGSAGPFNDYRFPSKLPEFLASGKPVVLPATNLGHQLADGEEALLLHRGDAAEIFDAVSRLVGEPGLRAKLGENGRRFALEHLLWERNVEPVIELYERVANGTRALPRVLELAERDTRARFAPPVKLVPFYLPQFHPIPENDEWWGEGFTEWTNATRAVPQFEGHPQPQLPGALGYYDLRDPEVLDRQAALARSYGIYGFCFYHYWFNGRRVLERPVDQMLARGEPDFPFCLCWANENWTRGWDGGDDRVLLEQEYAPGWDERFIRDILPALADRRYMTVDGAALLLVYRANLIPDVERAVERWRAIAREENGLDLHLVAVQSFDLADPRPFGFDAAVEFPPHTAHRRVLVDHDLLPGVTDGFAGFVEDYPGLMEHQLALELPDYRWYRGVMPSWDNTARRGRTAHILVNSSPDVYRTWLRKVVLQTLCRSPVEEPLVFVNAWNEWAEGTHLEPDERYGHGWLAATEGALNDGLRQYYASIGYELGPEQVAAHMRDVLQVEEHPAEHTVLDPAPATIAVPGRRPGHRPAPAAEHAPAAATITSAWFAGAELEAIRRRYRDAAVPRLGYATVRDYVDSWEHLRPLAAAQGDMKDVQRPWTLKSILATVPAGGRLLEIGAGQPYVADLLARLGYEVWVVDPYDGSGNGPVEFEQYRQACPGARFVRDRFSDELAEVEPGTFDCVYSISVLEHIDEDGLAAVSRGIRRALRPGGRSIHAVDHVHRGAGAEQHLDLLRLLAGRHGAAGGELEALLARMDGDTETYYLSAESHNRWRGATPYDEFPMRVCVSIELSAPASDLR